MKKIPLLLAALLTQSQVTGVTFPTFSSSWTTEAQSGAPELGLLGFPDASADLLVSEIFFSAQAEDWSLLPPSLLGV